MTSGGVQVANESSQLTHILEEPLDVVGLENDESSRVIWIIELNVDKQQCF